jgi:hypothetical protein
MGFMKDANGFDVIAMEGELGCVMEHQDEHAAGGHPVTGGVKMAGQNLFLVDPLIREKRYAALVLAQS